MQPALSVRASNIHVLSAKCVSSRVPITTQCFFLQTRKVVSIPEIQNIYIDFLSLDEFSCPDGYNHRLCDSCYKVVKEKKSWEDAYKNCHDKRDGSGGDLCTITSYNENEYIRKITEQSTHMGIWIGLSNQVKDGHPQWTDSKVSITLLLC